MFGIGMPEMLLILAIALIVIGPKKLPDLAKSIGRAMGEFKKATNEIKQSMEVDSSIKEVKDAFTEINEDIKESVSFDTIEDYQPKKKPSDTAAGEISPEKSTSTPHDSNQAMGTLKEAFDNLKPGGDDAPAPKQAGSEESSHDDEKGEGNKSS